MSAERDQPVRLADLPPEQDLVGAATLVRAAASSAPDISTASRRRIRDRLYDHLGRARAASFRRRHPVLVLVAVLIVGALGGAAVESAIAKWQSSRATPALPPVPSPAALAPKTPRRLAIAPAAPSPEMEPLADPTPPPSQSPSPRPEVAPSRWAAARDPRPHIELAPTSPTVPPPLELVPASGAPSPPAHAEAALLADAIRKLRVGGDAAAALALLEEHHARFGDGALAAEAAAVRVEALLALGRADAARLELERLDFDRIPRRDEWRVTRAEMRATSGRWAAAETDFAAVLVGPSGQRDDEVTERALWGRGVARARMGNVAAAREDWTAYLLRFPGGRFAGAARAALGTPATPR